MTIFTSHFHIRARCYSVFIDIINFLVAYINECGKAGCQLSKIWVKDWCYNSDCTLLLTAGQRSAEENTDQWFLVDRHTLRFHSKARPCTELQRPVIQKRNNAKALRELRQHWSNGAIVHFDTTLTQSRAKTWHDQFNSGRRIVYKRFRVSATPTSLSKRSFPF